MSLFLEIGKVYLTCTYNCRINVEASNTTYALDISYSSDVSTESDSNEA
jgi:hypothetical protein